MKKFLLSAFIAVAAISCKVSSVDDTVNPNEPADLNLTVNVASASAADSRIAIDDCSVEWSEGDALGAWANEPYNNDSFDKFEMTSYGAESSQFKGAISNGYFAETARFVYPFNETIKIYNLNNNNGADAKYCNAFDLNIANQTIEAENAHLAKNTYMMSETVDVDDLIDNTADKIEQTPSMKHLGAVLDLELLGFKADLTNYKLVSVDVASEKLPTVVSVNMQKENVEDAVTAKEFGTITLNVEGTKGQTNYLLSCNIFPFKLVSGDKINFVAHFVNPESNKYATITKEVNLTETLDFARAQRHALSVTMFGDLEFAPIEVTLDKVNGMSTSKNSGSFEVDGAAFVYENMYYNTEYGSYSLPKDVNAALYNVSEFEGLSKLVVTEDYYYYNVTVYCGTSVNNCSTELEYTKSGDDYTYLIPDGNNFIKFTNKSDYNATFDKAVFTCKSVGAAPAMITGVNPSELEFNFDETEGEIVTVSGIGLDGVDIAAKVTEGSENFEVIADGVELLVYPKAENKSGEAYTGAVTVSVEGSSATIAVSQLSKPLPAITGVSVDKLSFACDAKENDSQVVTIDGVSLEDAEITAVVTTGDTYFDVIADASELLIWTKDQNTTAQPYEGEVTIYLNGEEAKTVSLSQAGEKQATSVKTWVLNIDNFKMTNSSASSGYDKYNGDQTIAGVEINSSDIMVQSKTLQWKKTPGVMYNKTEMKNISKIVFAGEEQKDFEVYLSDSQLSSDGGKKMTSDNNGEFTMNNSTYSYFRIKNTKDKTTNIDTITVTFEE